LRRQADVLGWPAIFTADTVSDADLERALDYCLTAGARAQAHDCAKRGANRLMALREEFLAELRRLETSPRKDSPG
jgi:hypothetical protein